MGITKDQITGVKGRGFLLNRGTECFSGRIVTVGGLFTPDELHSIAECAETYGNGKVIFTSRLAAEIVGIPFEKIPEAEAFMAERGLYFGGTGAKVRPITACKGTTCVYGNIDTQALARVVYDRFYIGMKDVKLPHKFKIGVGGCPNSCMKPSLNDVGIEGCKRFSGNLPWLQEVRCGGKLPFQGCVRGGRKGSDRRKQMHKLRCLRRQVSFRRRSQGSGICLPDLCGRNLGQETENGNPSARYLYGSRGSRYD